MPGLPVCHNDAHIATAPSTCSAAQPRSARLPQRRRQLCAQHSTPQHRCAHAVPSPRSRTHMRHSRTSSMRCIDCRTANVPGFCRYCAVGWATAPALHNKLQVLHPSHSVPWSQPQPLKTFSVPTPSTQLHRGTPDASRQMYHARCISMKHVCTHTE